MGRAKSAVSAVAVRGVGALPLAALRAVETSARLAQGKGWDSGTVVQEVAASVSLLPKPTPPQPTVLDVGANVGLWSEALLASVPGAEVFAFEPSYAAFQQLTNRFQGRDNVHLVNAAVGRASGAGKLWADQAGSGLGSLTRRRLDHFGIDFSHSEEVRIVTLDEWCRENRVTPQVLKMDVEGHELDVLRGAEQMLREVQVVQFEFGGCNIDTRTYFQDFFYLLTESGFNIMRLTPKGLVAVPAYREQDESFETTNYFAVRRG